ncbi:epoxide hydrolase 4-like [Leptidea sinapis]|uniref:epoxide hydrolase 4-like n=1 Tax=Leptidea sinapis TaxID=189913 RepID=UPI0021334C2B|nr:epoxide hydrolase 4-like [Leptidea sinapis]
MSVKNNKVIQTVSGWVAVEILFQCVIIGFWQLFQLALRRLWKGHRRKLSKNVPPVELAVDTSIGIHCYIIVQGVKYHYVETGPKNGQLVLILGDAPDIGNLWVPSWSSVVQRLAENGYHVVTLDLRGTGGSESGDRCDLSPPKAVEELAALLQALEVSENSPAIVIGFGIGGMLTWYLVHCQGAMIHKFIVVGAPHPNLYWQHPPAAFCHRSLHFIQWPHFPERWLAEMETRDGARWSRSRARDWSGALNYVRGAAWYRIHPDHKARPRGLLMGTKDNAAQLVASAQHCVTPAIRLVTKPEPGDKSLPPHVIDFIVGRKKQVDEAPRGLVTRVLDAVADKGREFTARLALPANA